MKTLSRYTEQAQTDLFNSTGAFFAFSNEQLNKGKKEGISYVNMGAGLICPKDKSKILMDGLESIHKAGIEQDIEENGINSIIERELSNHEAGYTGEIEDTLNALRGYNVTREQVYEVYRSIEWND